MVTQKELEDSLRRILYMALYDMSMDNCVDPESEFVGIYADDVCFLLIGDGVTDILVQNKGYHKADKLPETDDGLTLGEFSFYESAEGTRYFYKKENGEIVIYDAKSKPYYTCMKLGINFDDVEMQEGE